MRWRGGHRAALVVVGLVGLCGAVEARARDCAAPAELLACSTNDDCGCGVRAGRCDVAARECVEPGECDVYCGGRYGYLGAVCRDGRCLRALPTDCAGDCDADAAVGIAELMVGVGVALATHPIAACSALDGNGDGVVGVAELVRAVRAALDGCAAAAGPFPGLRGYYDAEVTTSDVPSMAVASVYETDGELSLDIAEAPNRSLHLSGPLAAGRLTLTGYYLYTDIAAGISGEATIATENGEDVIRGAIVEDYPYADAPDAFVLRRSATENPARLSGVLTLHFSESPSGNGLPSRATLRFDVAAGGYALTGEGEDRGAVDVRYGSITTGTCHVAPRGHFACSTLYLPAGSAQPSPLRLTGLLDANGGSGSFLSGTDPPFDLYVYGGWDADRD